MYVSLMPIAHLAWATFFRWRGMTWLPRLAYAYRAPMLFAGEGVRRGLFSGTVGGADEQVLAADYDGRGDRNADGTDMIYMAGHGRLRSGEFELLLHSDEWRPASSGLDAGGPKIAIFDACDLVDLQDTRWSDPWRAQIRPNLRMLLGFNSLATVKKGAALRGEEFASRLSRGEPVAGAWIGAVKQHDAHGRERPVAIGFGSSVADADRLLENATFADVLAMPPLESDVVVRERV